MSVALASAGCPESAYAVFADRAAITHLIVNPGNNQVKTLVVARGSFLPEDIEIPLEAIQKRDSEGVSVLYTGEQAKQMPRFDARTDRKILSGLPMLKVPTVLPFSPATLVMRDP